MATKRTLEPLVPGSVETQLLATVWGGARVTIVDSPPGAGKTSLIAWLCDQLLERTNLTVRVATPTRNAAAMVQQRIVERADSSYFIKLDMSGQPKEALKQFSRVSVSTVSRLQFSSISPYDVLIIDEAYQLPFSQMAAAANKAEQIVLVGDPGQIGPVIRSQTELWSKQLGPQVRAPEVFHQDPDATRLSLPSTYRLGEQTRAIVADFYDFEFDSCRPDRRVTDRLGHTLDEVNQHRITPVSTVNDATHLQEIVAVVDQLVGGTITGEDGVPRTLEAKDVCVVTSHSSQCDRLASLLDGRLAGVKTGTADRLQGGEWPVVVAVDPLVGHNRAGVHQLATGRLCVMLSRHSGALVWLHDGLPGRLEALAADAKSARVGLSVRNRLTATKKLPTPRTRQQ